MLSTILFIFISLATALAGTLCPPREKIYPCSCINLAKKSRQYTTIIYCHRLDDSDSLEKIFSSLSKLVIDHFHLYDSFWQADEKKKHLPEDWLSKLKSKDIEIMDTPLSKNFACSKNRDCRNDATTRFSIFNSTYYEKMETICTFAGRNNSYSWISCMHNLEELQFSYGKLTSIDTDFLPIELKKLRQLNLSQNMISRVHKNAFSKVSGLKFLDLSHNRLISLDNFFAVKMDLELLDVSYNNIKTLDENLFPCLPKLITLNAKSNRIINLDEKHWKMMPSTLRNIDVMENPLHCHCNIKWMNGTVFSKLKLVGRCHTPKNYKGNYIKQRIALLAKVCDDKGNIRKLTTPSKM